MSIHFKEQAIDDGQVRIDVWREFPAEFPRPLMYWICPECGCACSFMGQVCKHWLKACAEELARLKA